MTPGAASLLSRREKWQVAFARRQFTKLPVARIGVTRAPTSAPQVTCRDEGRPPPWRSGHALVAARRPEPPDRRLRPSGHDRCRGARGAGLMLHSWWRPADLGSVACHMPTNRDAANALVERGGPLRDTGRDSPRGRPVVRLADPPPEGPGARAAPRGRHTTMNLCILRKRIKIPAQMFWNAISLRDCLRKQKVIELKGTMRSI